MSDVSAPARGEGLASRLRSGEGHPQPQLARNLIDGSWVAAVTGSMYERRNPAHPTQLTGPLPDSAAQAGVLHVNATTTGAEVHVPFGGIKASGWGRTSRDERRSSSTRTPSPSTRTPDEPREHRDRRRTVTPCGPTGGPLQGPPGLS